MFKSLLLVRLYLISSLYSLSQWTLTEAHTWTHTHLNPSQSAWQVSLEEACQGEHDLTGRPGVCLMMSVLLTLTALSSQWRQRNLLCVLSTFAILKSLYPFIQLSVYSEALSQVAQAGLKLYVDEDVLELLICPALLPSPKCWDHKHAPGFMWCRDQTRGPVHSRQAPRPSSYIPSPILGTFL